MRQLPLYVGIVALVAATSACTTFPIIETLTQPTQALPSEGFPTLPASTAIPLPEDPRDSALPLDRVDLVALYERVNPGVVSILTFSTLEAPNSDRLPTGQGSGFVIDKLGHIVTNQHVVADADEIEIDFPSGLKAWATLVGTDPDSDLSVLRVDVPEGQLAPLPLGDSAAIRVGETVIAIGNPFGLSGTMTMGIVSALGRTLESNRLSPGGDPFSAGDLIQTDAAINPGNSGGPLINVHGEVIGVNRAIRTSGVDTGNIGVGFAVPVNIVRRVVPVLIALGSYDYPYLGVSSLNELNLNTLEVIGLPPDTTGAYITCVTPGGPAAKAGLLGAGSCDPGQPLRQGGDLIIAIDGQSVRQFNDMLSYLIMHTQVGQEIVLTVRRAGEEVDLTVLLEARP